MTSSYNRSEIYSLFDLSENERNEWIKDNDFDVNDENANIPSFVRFDRKDETSDYLNIGMFMRTDKNNFTHGVYGTSNFDGYFITFNRSNDECIVAHKHF